MPILSKATFLTLFDKRRVKELASTYDGASGQAQYDSTIIDTILLEAEGVVKNALSKIYSTAEMEADANCERMVASIAIHLLYQRRPSRTVPSIITAYNDVLNQLEQLQSEAAKLAAVSQLLPSGPSEAPTEATDSGYFD